MSQSQANARTRGIHHAGLTVPNLSATQRFFEEALGFQRIGEVPSYPAVFLSDGTVMLTLWQAEDPQTATPFDRRKNIGLHHFALLVDGHDALAQLHSELAARDDVEVEFAPEALGSGEVRHMMCAIPGGVRMELIAPPGA